MSLFIDQPYWPGHGRLWAHLISDSSFEELHQFAGSIGIPRRGFDGDHYDIPADRWSMVVDRGVTPTDSKDVVRRLRAAGLRRPKHLR
ncbi:uncharacterized protein DUF4031 [Antricoccus suffuscus]|uniref:Uncharacterized protein DUF4031 n=1 Tax=Antricoccus suffuscus TaxID=1629062 RepID=A0A2T0ZJW2_9ACTN|nr:DUF4031 domain-containing protein [Antricoccus suffuscus]PRZ36636.1 uncharacterized protein DUF4031 [Antricoccus suffuscus]